MSEQPVPPRGSNHRAPEMHEVADTLSDQHLPTALATANVLQRWAATGQPTDPATILRQLHTHPS